MDRRCARRVTPVATSSPACTGVGELVGGHLSPGAGHVDAETLRDGGKLTHLCAQCTELVHGRRGD